MGIKEIYKVQSIKKEETKQWLLYKHYAKRVPPIELAFGLYKDKVLQGVCTFGMPARMLNNGYGCFGDEIEVKTYELNRLVINEGLKKNALSYFVAECLNLIPKPCCIVSYADGNNGHHGYIYQATNWIYTGITASEKMYIDKRKNKIVHPRTIVEMFGSRELSVLPDWIEVSKEESGKYRYFQFLGNKTDRKRMKKHLKYDVLPYPKGNNNRYDASFKPQTQGLLF
jgi:hypothetical protein